MSDNKKLNIKNILLIHIFICIFGLLELIAILSRIVSDAIFIPFNNEINYNYWAELSSPSLGKPAHLIQYIFSVILVFSCYGYFIILRDRINILENNEIINKLISNRFQLFAYFLLIIFVNLLVFINLSYSLLWVSLIAIFWLGAFLLPVLPLFDKYYDSSGFKYFRNIGLIGLISILLCWMFWIFTPYISGGMPIRNDYMDISSQTFIDGEYVDNTSYINKFSLGGLNKYDPRVDQGSSPAPNISDSIRIKNSSSLNSFLEKDGNKSKYYYDESRGLLVVKGQMSLNDRNFLIEISENSAERNDILNLYNKEADKKIYSKENIVFVKKNIDEFVNQVTAGHFFHHHNAMFSPINEYVLGKEISQINFFYGWFNSVTIITLSNLIGGTSFDNYIQITYSFYLLYFLFVIAVSSFIFKRLDYVLLVALISVVFTNILGFEHIRFGPGLNPIRHYSDVFVLLFFYLYLFFDRKKQFFLTLAFSFSLLGVLINRELGIVLFISFSVSIFIFIARKSINKYKDFSILIFAFIFLIAIVLNILEGSSENKTLIYSLLGVSVPETPSTLLFCLLLFFSGVYVLLVHEKNASDYRLRYLLFFWFAYSQGLLIYYIWNPAPNHLTCLGSVWAILFSLIIKFIFSSVYKNYESKILLIPILFISFFALLPTSLFYVVHQKNYYEEFKNHKVYQWNFPSAQFSTTMDPSYFENAISLIHKYEKDNGIYIVSKYDNILPFLSQKYSKMPFVEVGLSLVSDKEMKQCIDAIRNNSPEFLFVDTDIKRSYLGDVYDPNDKVTKLLGTALLSSGRVEVLSNFQRLFLAIEDDYELVEKGILISVYQRK